MSCPASVPWPRPRRMHRQDPQACRRRRGARPRRRSRPSPAPTRARQRCPGDRRRRPTRLEAVALRPGRAVDRHRALSKQPLCNGAHSDLRPRGERLVEPRPCVVVSDREAKRRHRVLRAFGASDRRGRASPNRIATPTTMNMSARLKAGHATKSRKSVTCPSRTRSIRFAMLPPSTKPSATGSTGWRLPSGRRTRALRRRRLR